MEIVHILLYELQAENKICLLEGNEKGNIKR